MEDMLVQMLKLQDEFQKTLPNGSPKDMEENGIRIGYIQTMVLALTDELHEALNETGWKSWASSNHINEEAFKNELVDAWHFFMNLILVSGMSAEEFYIRYRRKREKNIKRQEDGYDGLNKCPKCRRAYDDDAVGCFPINSTTGDPAFCATAMRIITSDKI